MSENLSPHSYTANREALQQTCKELADHFEKNAAGGALHATMIERLIISEALRAYGNSGPNWRPTEAKYTHPLAWESNTTGKIVVCAAFGGKWFQIELPPPATGERSS